MLLKQLHPKDLDMRHRGTFSFEKRMKKRCYVDEMIMVAKANNATLYADFFGLKTLNAEA